MLIENISVPRNCSEIAVLRKLLLHQNAAQGNGIICFIH